MSEKPENENVDEQAKSNEELSSFIEGTEDSNQSPETLSSSPQDEIEVQLDEETKKRLLGQKEKPDGGDVPNSKVDMAENPFMKAKPEKEQMNRAFNIMYEPEVDLSPVEEDTFWDQFLFGQPLSAEIPLKLRRKNKAGLEFTAKFVNRTAFQNNVMKLSMYLMIKEHRALDDNAYVYYYQLLAMCMGMQFTTLLPDFSPYKCDDKKSVSENAQALIAFSDKFSKQVNEQVIPILFRALRTFETKQAIFGDRCQNPLS